MKQILDFIKTKTSFFLLIIIGVLVFFLAFQQCSNNKLKREVTIFQDSTHYLKNKSGELFAQNDALILSKKQLKDLNVDLYNEINKMKENPLVITKIQTKFVYKDTLLITTIDTVYKTQKGKYFELSWKHDTLYSPNNFFKIEGKTSFEIDSNLNICTYRSRLNNLQMAAKLYVSITEDKEHKMLHINARTDYPGLVFSDIDGFIIDPQKSSVLKNYLPNKKFSLSAFIGPGVCIGTGSFPVNAGVVMGLGISYHIISF